MLSQLLKEHKKWSDAVQLRDKYTCQWCYAIACRQHAHHLSEDLDKTFDSDNGITLCVGCHRTVHAIFKNGSTAAEIRSASRRIKSSVPSLKKIVQLAKQLEQDKFVNGWRKYNREKQRGR